MRKVEFIKTDIGVCIYLDDCLFQNDDDRIGKLIEVLKLFPFKELSLSSNCFINEDETYLEEIKDLFECEIKIMFTKTKLFSKKKYSKVEIAFNGEDIDKVIDFIIRKDISLCVECYNDDQTFVLQFVVNDNSGACITFNSKIFNAEEIKSKVKEIFK